MYFRVSVNLEFSSIENSVKTGSIRNMRHRQNGCIYVHIQVYPRKNGLSKAQFDDSLSA